AHLEQGRDIAPLRDIKPNTEAEPDSLLVAIWEGEQATRFQHLINHQADGGYYLPVDFPQPIWLEFDQDEQDGDERLEEPVVSFGSSIALQRELAELAGMLEQAGVSQKSAPYRCLTVLREAADQ